MANHTLPSLAVALLIGCGGSESTPPAPPPASAQEAPKVVPPTPEASAESGGRGQCLETEESWFDCTTTDGGWLSVCGPKGAAEETTWLQLRHGPAMAAHTRFPAEATSLEGIGWERSEDTTSVLRAMHFAEGAAVFTVLPAPGRGDPSTGALLPGLEPIGCRTNTVEDSLPDVAGRLKAPERSLAAVGTLGPLQSVDAACYVFLGSNAGARIYNADLDLCESAAEFVGRDVVLDFTPGQVVSAIRPG
jgi:hypothetical protein